jgi:hypothetical protein
MKRPLRLSGFIEGPSSTCFFQNKKAKMACLKLLLATLPVLFCGSLAFAQSSILLWAATPSDHNTNLTKFFDFAGMDNAPSTGLKSSDGSEELPAAPSMAGQLTAGLKASNLTYCQGESFSVTYQYDQIDPIAEPNTYTIQLSNDNFVTHRVIGRLVSAIKNGTIQATIPFDAARGGGYEIRIVASSAPLVASTEYGPYTIAGPRNLGLVDDVSACLGADATFMTSTGASSPTYLWKKICNVPGSMFTNSKAGLSPMGTLASNLYYYDDAGTGRLYAATAQGLAVSTDDGANFTLYSGVGQVNDVFVDGNNIYLATPNGVKVSPTLDGSGVFSTAESLTAFNAIYANGSTVVAAGVDGLYVSADSGVSFPDQFTTANGLGTNAANDVFIATNGTIYAATSSGISILYPGQTTFVTTTMSSPSSGLLSNIINSIYVDGAGIIYLGTGNGVSVSTDGGIAFSTTTSGLGTTAVSDIFVHQSIIYAATSSGLSVMFAGANKFTNYTEQQGLGSGSINSLAANAGTVFAGNFNGVSKGSISGATSDAGSATATLNLTGIAPADNCRYYAEVTAPGCPAVQTNIASLNNIPPAITATAVTPTTGCDKQDGMFTISGLYPNLAYQLFYTEPSGGSVGFPAPGPVSVTTDTLGQINVKFLKAGIYTDVYVKSTVGPNCESNRIASIQILNPAKPAAPNPTLPVAAVCAGEDITVIMPTAVMAPLQYRWYTNITTTTPANPAISLGDYTLASAPLSSGSLWVRTRNTTTNCVSDSVKVDYTVNPGVTISHDKTEPSTATATDGTITITVSPAGAYTITSSLGPVAQSGNTFTYSGLGVGNYSNFLVTSTATGCESNLIASCPLLGPPPPGVIGTKNLQTTVCEIPGTAGGYLQNVTDARYVSPIAVDESAGAIAVGRIRQTTATPTGPADENEKVEMRGWIQFNLSSIPVNASITKVEFTPKSVVGGFQLVNEVDVLSGGTAATGDIQFDITQMSDFNYAPYGGFSNRAFDDQFEVKYNDFVIGSDATGAKVDLGAAAVADVQRRLASASTNQLFQLGLTLSGTDFDLPVFQFHGKVFDLSANQQLCITYELRDYGDLPEPKFATDLAGGLVGPSHVINLVDLDANPITTPVLHPAMYIGSTTPDAEANGQPNATATGDNTDIADEDINDSWFTNPATNNTLVSGSTIRLTVPVTNNLPDSVNVVVFVDWNNNGVFENTPAERSTKKVAPNPNLPDVGSAIQVPFDLSIPNVAKADSIGVRIRLTSGAVLDAYGPAPDGEVEDFIIELRGTDYGDLPDATTGTGNNDYQTLKANNGARHGVPVTPLVYMGTAIDTESDGQPNLSSVGDDNNLPVNDEDGIIFLGPLVPGKNAQLAFQGVNKVGIDAKLHIWADWNNDGTLEYVSGTTFASSASPISQIITFAVPANATFDGGKIFFRFRFTSDVAFNAAVPNPSPNDLVYDGEVEDYFLPIFKMGNLVWEDRNHNGLQDNEEINLGIQNVRVVLRFGGINPNTGAYDEVTQSTATNPNTPNIDGGVDAVRDSVLQTYTDAKGLYDFVGLIEGRYQIIALDTFGLTPTRFDHIKNVTEEDLDSDGNPLKNPWDYVSGDRRQSKSQIVTLEVDQIGTDEEGILDQGNPQLLDPNAVGVFPDDRVEQRIDFGYVGLDLGDLAEATDNPTSDPSVTNFLTRENGTKPEGPKHIVTPDLSLGNCQDIEWLAQPDADAGADFKPVPVVLGGGDDPVADFSNYPGAIGNPTLQYDPSQGRRWPFHDAANTCGDDEDGIRFLTPMIAGYNAMISVKYKAKNNFDGPDAYLHAWMDWNGDGNFDDGAGNIDANEHIIFTLLDGKPTVLEPNTQAVQLEMEYLTSANDSITLTFKVPADVKYNNGNVLSRFRLSYDPRLGPNGILAANLNFPDPQPGAGGSQLPGGIIPYGEVEDYFISLSKVGNTVFEDRDYDGFQDVLEPGIANVPIKLQFAGADGILNNGDPYEFTYHDTTDANGRYFFCGLIGNVDPSGIPNPVYQLIVEDPAGMTATFNNPDLSDDACIDDNSNGDDLLIDNRITTDTFTITNPMMLCLDENAPRNDVGGLVPGNNLPPAADALNNFPDNQYDETRDFGYTGFDYGDLPVATVLSGSNYLTLRDSMDAKFNNKFGPRHAIQPRLYLGRGVDGELNGKPDADAGSKAGGDDDDQGAFKKGATADDETGVRLLSPLLPGEFAYIKVNYTSQDTNNGSYVNRTAYLDAFIDWNGNGVMDIPAEKVEFTHQAFSTTAPFSTNNVPALGAPTRTATLPATNTTGVDSTILAFLVPTTAVFDSGTVFMRFRLGWTNYATQFPIAFPNGLGDDNNIFHMTVSPYVKAYEPFNDVADNTGRYPYPQGEVEDYAIPVAKIGNLAWFDHDVFGDQDANEDVVDSLHLVLIWGGVDGSTGAFDTVGYQTSLSSLGAVTDILYNRSIAPNAVGAYPPGALVKTGISPAADSGLYSFRGLIPGIYYVLPMKYFATDSASFVNAWPKHRVVTLQDNPGVDDNNDSDGLTKGVAGTSKGPGAFVKITDSNSREPEVEVNDRPLSENGKRDADDNANPFTTAFFPDSQWDKTVDIGWVDEPNIEANLDIVGVYFPTSKLCNNFNVIMHLCVKNPQEVPLDSLQAFLDLKAAYGNALYTGTKPKVSIADSAYIKGPAYGKYRKSQLEAKQQLVPNPNYDGVSDLRLLLPTSENANFLLRGDSIVCIRVEFEIDPSQTEKYPWMSQGQVTARAVGFNKQTGAKRPLTDFRFFHPRFGKSIVVFDATDEFNDPMPGSDMIAFEGMVADRGLKGDYQPPYVAPNVTGRDKYEDENDKTVQNDECWIKTRWNSGIKDVRVALNSKCESIINADIFVPNFIPACGFDKYTEGSYYAVIIQDKWTKETIWTSDDPRPFDAKKYLDRKLIYTVISVANSCIELWGDFILEDKIAPVVRCAPDTDRKVVGTTPTGTYSFVCTDIDSVLNVAKSWTNPNYAYYTGIAVGNDSCGQTWLDNVKDALEVFADCNVSANTGFAYARITRTFTFIDEKNNKITCNQIITFRRPKIILPECRVEIPNNLSGRSKDLVPADLIKAPFNLTESVPYYLNGAGKRIYLTGRDYCGFALNYTDESVFNVGACGKKIIRRWTILDWCYGTKGDQAKYPVYHLVANADSACYAGLAWNEGTLMLTWEQQLIVGDNGDPIVAIPDYDRDGIQGSGYPGGERDKPEDDKLPQYDAGDVLIISTGPMDCKGGYFFTRKDLPVTEQSSWCFDLQVLQRAPILDPFKRPTGSYEWKTDPGVSVKGDCDKGYAISGIPMLGNWFLRLRVYDVCNKDTVIYYPIRATDQIAPVMKCDDRLVLSLNNGGLGFVSGEQVDEGSWDNCGAVEWKRLRRPISDACNPNFIGIKGVVDANGNGKIDAYNPALTTAQDYVDVNRNRKADPEEYFTINPATNLLMTPLMDSVPFFCCDRGSVMVELWGGDKAGNRNFCWNNIEIEDKTAPQCSAPWTTTIYCNDKNLEFIDSKIQSAKLFGDVVITSGNLCADFDTVYTVVKRLKCGAGTIERIWTLTKKTVKGDLSLSCKQIIKVLPVREYNIYFPKDVDQRDCKAPVIDTAFTQELGCDILAVNVTDKRYDASNDECYKIFRTYTVIDWCAYDDNCGDPTADGIVYVVDRSYSNYGQTPIYVLVRDADLDQREEFYLSLNDTPKEGNLSDSKVGTDNDEAFVPAYCENAFSDNPYGLPVGEFYHAFQYTQIIKVYDDVKPVVTGDQAKFCIREGGDCMADLKMIVKGTDNCTDQVTMETNLLAIAPFQTREVGSMIGYSTSRWSVKALDGGQFEINVSNLPQGKHDLIVVVRDECGNLSEPTRIPFTVEDCKGPAPICINGLSTSLMPDGNGSGMITVWATDLVASKVFDCNGQGPETSGNGKMVTKYSINRVGSPAVDNQTSLIFNCKDAGKVIQVELHAWDNAGNHDFCVTFIEVQDNRKLCNIGDPGVASITGLIATDESEPVVGVSVDVSGASTLKQITANSGAYAFSNLTKGADFSLSAQLDKDHVNGVSTFDLVLIQKHILGTKLIDNPYRLIAADVNNSKSVSTLDMIQIRKLILQVDDKFKNVPSWKFVDAAYRFPDASNPFGAEYPEVINVNNLNGNVKADFVAIKMGDVNGNAATVNGIAAAEIRTNRHLLLAAEEQVMKVDGSYEVAIRAKDLQNIQGYQFTLTYAQNLVELEGIDYGVAKADNFGIFKDKGAITTSWNLSSGVGAAGNEVLFTLKLKAKANTKLSEVLNLSSRLTPAEAYDKENETIGVKLSFGEIAIQDFAVLRQNTPNPFSDETSVGFYLPKAAKGILTIRDTKGSLIYRVNGTYSKGENKIVLKQAELRASGVLYYTLETADFIDTKKMILLNR